MSQAVLKERYDKVLHQRQRDIIMAEVSKLESIPLKGGHGDHHFKNRDEVGKEYGLSGSSVGRLLKVNDLKKPLCNKLDNGSLIFKVYHSCRNRNSSWYMSRWWNCMWSQWISRCLRLYRRNISQGRIRRRLKILWKSVGGMVWGEVKSQKDYGSIEDCRGCLRKVSSIFCACHLKCWFPRSHFWRKSFFVTFSLLKSQSATFFTHYIQCCDIL